MGVPLRGTSKGHALDSFVSNSLCCLEFRNRADREGGRDVLIPDLGLQGKGGWALRCRKQRVSDVICLEILPENLPYKPTWLTSGHRRKRRKRDGEGK